MNGDGPFSPERSGSLPVGDFAALCFSGTVTYDEVKKMIKGQGGVKAYLGTNDLRIVEKNIADGDKKAELILRALAYQVSKEIGGAATVLKGQVDGIVLTGGIVYDKNFVEMIKENTSFIATVYAFPGEMEMQALAFGGLRVLKGIEQAKEYNPS